MTSHGPKWLGIGAQRSGTTWFTDLLAQHPLVDVPGGVKEHQELYRYGLMHPWEDEARRAYAALFDHEEVLLGEFSPAYMRSLWICDLTHSALPADAPIIVLLRDPIERFASALRHEAEIAIRRHEKRVAAVAADQAPPPGGVPEEDDPPIRPLPHWRLRDLNLRLRRKRFLGRVAAAAARRYVLGAPLGKRMQDRVWLRHVGGDASWGGMYGAQLAAWTKAMPKERFIVIQYERLKRDPQSYVDQVWKRLGVDPIPLEKTDNASRSSTRANLWVLEDHPHLVSALRAAYRADSELLAKEWDIDLSLWKRLTDEV